MTNWQSDLALTKTQLAFVACFVLRQGPTDFWITVWFAECKQNLIFTWVNISTASIFYCCIIWQKKIFCGITGEHVIKFLLA
jgi:hypothetical protein